MRLVDCDRDMLDIAISLERDGAVARALRGGLLNWTLARPFNVCCIEPSGHIVGAGGIFTQGDTAQAWMLVSRFATRKQIVKGIALARGWLDTAQRRYPVIECFVAEAAPYRAAFTRALGFVLGERREDLHGRVYLQYVRQGGA